MTIPVVSLAGLTFNDGADGDGDEFWVGDIDGWDGAPAEQIFVERPLSDGAVLVWGRRTSWTMTVSGTVISGGSMGRARKKLEAAMNSIVSANGTLEVDEDDGTTTVAVRLIGRLRTRQLGPIAIAFDADLLAADPEKSVVGS